MKFTPLARPETKKTGFTIPQKSHPAILYGIICLGTHTEMTQYGEKTNFKLVFKFELPFCKHTFKEENGAEPAVISTFPLNYQVGEKAKLRAIMEACKGKMTDAQAVGQDIFELIGSHLTLDIGHTQKDGNTYANIAGFAQAVDGIDYPKPHNQAQVLNFTEWDQELFDKQPQFLKDKITASVEYKRLVKPDVNTGGFDIDEVPF